MMLRLASPVDNNIYGAKNQRGLTLLEIIIVTTFIAILVGVIYRMFVVSLKTWESEETRVGTRQDVSWAMDRMVRELRGSLEITAAGTNSVSFWWKDLNGNGVRELKETVTYSWSGAPGDGLNRTLPGSTIILTHQVTNFQLGYKDESGNTTATPADVHLISITLTAQRESETISLRSQVHMRNL